MVTLSALTGGVQNVLPKVTSARQGLTSLGSKVGTFVKENPIISGLGVSTLIVTPFIATRVRRKKKKTTRKTKRRTKKSGKRKKKRTSRTRGRGRITHVRRSTTRKRRKRRITHSSPRHKGHKRVKFRTKDGKVVSFLAVKK